MNATLNATPSEQGALIVGFNAIAWVLRDGQRRGRGGAMKEETRRRW